MVLVQSSISSVTVIFFCERYLENFVTFITSISLYIWECVLCYMDCEGKHAKNADGPIICVWITEKCGIIFFYLGTFLFKK